MIWITGLSGAGKSTLAAEMASLLRGAGKPTVVVDGDEVRRIIDDPSTGHDPAGRMTNALRICRLARYLESQGLLVLVASMSLFHEIHRSNRERFDRYLEILIDVDVDTLRRRDARGIYSRAAGGIEQHVAGVDLAYELPLDPDHVVHNDGKLDALKDEAFRILERFELLGS